MGFLTFLFVQPAAASSMVPSNTAMITRRNILNTSGILLTITLAAAWLRALLAAVPPPFLWDFRGRRHDFQRPVSQPQLALRDQQFAGRFHRQSQGESPHPSQHALWPACESSLARPG